MKFHSLLVSHNLTHSAGHYHNGYFETEIWFVTLEIDNGHDKKMGRWFKR